MNGLAVGSVIPIDGATVGSVRLFAPGGHLVTTARLGQSAGMRAVRFGARATVRDARYSGTQRGGDREFGLGQRVDLSAHAAQFIAGLLGCAQNIIRGHLSCLAQRP